MRKSAMRFTALVAICTIAGSAAAQQAATTPVEVGPPPNWDVLLRPRTHAATPTGAAITAADLASRLYIFADDSMQGRLLGTPGNVKGVEYIAREAKRIGLIPLGDNGTYFQTVAMVERAYDPSTKLGIGSASFTPWTDYVLRDQGPGARSLDGVQAIYGGTLGDSASLIDPSAVAGKIVVFNANQNAFNAGSPGGVNRSMVTQRFIGAAGIAVASLELTPAPMIKLFQQPKQIVKNGDQSRSLPSFLYVTKRVA